MMAVEVQNPPVAIACGGTGGHLFPGLAVADALRSLGAPVSLMVSPKDVDQRALQQAADLEVVTLPSVGLQRGQRLRFMASAARTAAHVARRFRRQRPQAVLSMGGFTGVGPVLAARALRIPVYLHESNAVPGRANLRLSRFAREVFVGFPGTEKRFGRRTVCVGTPVRPQFAPAEAGGCRRLLGLDPARPLVLVAGGSQGASGVNDLVMRALPGVRSLMPQWQWLHLSGPHDEVRVRQAYQSAGVEAQVHGFFDRMELALGAASAAISRAGASSLAELSAMRVPAILIPFPHATDNHQFHNAAAFEATGAAMLCEQADLKPESLLAALCPLVEDAGTRQRMQAALAAWHRSDAAAVMSFRILGLQTKLLPKPQPCPEADAPHGRACVVT
jgi:UDP-N-acetylglucosamine--N-acetylmuramyl-(pentapeptide) pyrophosphoryl-undecaprenol N-acetylglucosamine transferase